MKTKLLMTAVLTGLLSTGSYAGFEQFNDPSGEMNWYSNAGGNQGDWLNWSSWGVGDLQSITTDNRTFQLLPNVNTYGDGTDAYWVNIPAQDGNKWMEANTLFTVSSISNNMIAASFSFTVDEFDLDPRYSLTGFIRVLDPSADHAAIRNHQWDFTTTGSTNLSINIAGTAGMVLQAGWQMNGLNANPSSNWGSATVTATAIGVDTGDGDAPTPNPMTFATAPNAISDQAVSMTATEATDESEIQYFFDCTTPGGHDSDWQSSTSYTDSGLAPGTLYSYTVTARDLSILQNTTAPSAPASATTQATDTTTPSPDPMTFSVAPVAASTLISMTATSATDAAPVEYYFTCTTAGGHNSGWQSSASYTDSGLTPGTVYSYTVTARDLSAAMNTTAASAEFSATTTSPELWMINSLTGYTGDTWLDSTVFDLNADGLEYGSVSEDPVSAISLDGSGATFSTPAAGYWGRNVLRTIAQNYDAGSFVAYATFAFDGTADQGAFIGLGQGIVAPAVNGNWGVPDLSLGGVNSVIGEMKTSLSSNPDHQGCNLLKVIDGAVSTNFLSGPIPTIDTFKVKLDYDADANTATISVDTEYTGGTFVADLDLGTIDTNGEGGTNMWFGAPVRVYAGGGEGTVVTDLTIVNSDPAPVVISIEGGSVISWDAEAGQVYDVQYTTDLVNGPASWPTDPSSGCSDILATVSGTLSATSTVSDAAVYYRVISQ